MSLIICRYFASCYYHDGRGILSRAGDPNVFLKSTMSSALTGFGSYLIKNPSNVHCYSGHSVILKPKASEVLTSYLKQTGEPPWTSYFVKHRDVINDQYGMSHFNWQVGQSNYTILRVGCFPFIKYHCTRGPKRDLVFEDKFFRFIKVANFGIPCLMYGIAALFLIKHREVVHLENGKIYIYFLIKENLGSHY